MQSLTEAPWPSITLFALLYVSDYAFTIACARMYGKGIRDILVFEGSFELTPFFQKDVDARRVISPRFLLALAWGVTMFGMVWWLSKDVWPEAYEFLLGGWVFLQLAVHSRHVRNLVLFRNTLAGRGVRGRIEYPRRLMLQLSALELVCFAVVYLVGFLVTWSSFLLGGSVTCLVNAGKHARLARKHGAEIRGAAQQGVEADEAR